MDSSQGAVPRRLLILTDSPILVSGGSERFLRNLLGRLPAADYQVTLVQLCEQPPASAMVQQQLPASVCNAMFLPFEGLYGRAAIRAYRAVRRLVKHEGFDVIQSQHEKSDVFNAWLPRGERRALRISNRRDTGFLKSARLRRLSRLHNWRIDLFVAPSASILEAVGRSEGVPQKKMRCIPNGVDTDHFHPADPAARRGIRFGIGCAETDLLIGCVADLFAVKRHIDLIKGFAFVREKFPSAHLLVIGDGPLRGAVEARVQDCHVADAVHLLGSRKDVDAILPALDLFALASDTEGLSNAILEAQACGLPVVATNVGGNPDLVDAECGRLVAPRAPEAMAEAICELLHDPYLRTRMGTAGRARVVRDHSLDAMTRAYANLYRERPHAR